MRRVSAPTPHVHRLRVRYGETDQMGVVHHANYLHYMEDGRTRFMESLGLAYATLEARGFGLPVRRAQLRYLIGARYDDELCVHTTVAGMRAASVAFRYLITRGTDPEERLATGEVELACVDLRSPERKPVALPKDVRALFAPRIAPSDPA